MINEKMLSEASDISSGAHAEKLITELKLNSNHEFSEGFEKACAKLERKSLCTPKYTARKIAAVFAAVVFAGAVFFASNQASWAHVLGWTQGLYNKVYYHFKYNGEAAEALSGVKYILTKIPEGYEYSNTNFYHDLESVVYENEGGQILVFEYYIQGSSWELYINKDGMICKETTVNGSPATLISDPSNDSAKILWESDGVLFSISGPFKEKFLKKMAKSVVEK